MQFKFGKIETDFKLSNTTIALAEMYSNFNKEHFDADVKVDQRFLRLNNLIYDIFSQKPNSVESTCMLTTYGKLSIDSKSEKQVVLLFSGGLDSCFQALVLKSKGYDVTLLHAKNLNQYENNVISNNPVKSFAAANEFKLKEINIWHNQSKGNPYRKFWPENPIKNQLLISIACDYCINYKIPNISLGDDNNLSLEESVTGVNTTDTKEVLEAALYGLKSIYTDLNFITIDEKYRGNKEIRLKWLRDANLLDDYSSCVGPGRLIAMQNNRYRAKFNLNLPKWNCCTCRKCCMHLLIMHYSKDFDFTLSKEALQRCWYQLAHTGKGADYPLFNESIDLDTRIYNLFHY